MICVSQSLHTIPGPVYDVAAAWCWDRHNSSRLQLVNTYATFKRWHRAAVARSAAIRHATSSDTSRVPAAAAAQDEDVIGSSERGRSRREKKEEEDGHDRYSTHSSHNRICPEPSQNARGFSYIIVEAHDGKILGENNADNAIRRALKILMECPFKSESDCAKCTCTFIDVGTIIEDLHKIRP